MRVKVQVQDQMQWLNLLSLIALLWQLWPIPLSAHSDLQSSTPAAGEDLSIVPSEIELIFSQALRDQSQISLAKPNFEFVGGLSVQITGEDRNVLQATLPRLTPGVYTVHWVSIAEDGDMLRGSYSFSVKEGATLPPNNRRRIWLGLGLLLCVVLTVLFIGKRTFQTK